MNKLKNGKIIDEILRYCLSNPNSFWNFSNIKRDLFPDLNKDEMLILLDKIDSLNHKVLDIESGGGYNSIFKSNGLTERFLEQGGFTELEKQEKLKNDKAELKEQIDFDKSKIDLELAKKMLEEYPYTKWVARIGFIIGVCLALLELYKYIKTE